MGPETAERILELLDEVEEKIENLRGEINGILSWVPWGLGWAVDKFMDLWDKAMAKLGEFWDKLRNIVANLGQPWVLNEAKGTWVEVGGPVSERASEATRGQSDVDFAWKGRAADRYALALSEQRGALTVVRDKLTAVMGPALGDVATALYIFFVAMAAAVAALVTAIVVATGETVSILGLPAVPVTLIAGIVAAITAIGLATNELLGSARSAETVFSNVLNSRGDFGADNWPSAVI